VCFSFYLDGFCLSNLLGIRKKKEEKNYLKEKKRKEKKKE